MKKFVKGHLFAPLVGIALAHGAYAQPATTPDKKTETEKDVALPQVTVTAERRTSTLQKVPVTISVADNSVLEEKVATGIKALQGEVPGLSIPSNGQVSSQSIFIRGMGSPRPIAFPSVGFYVDDVYLPRNFGQGIFGTLPDLDRIEVLRGPQGTLYGQNSSAGAIKLISRDPTADARAWGELRAGNQGAKQARGYVSGALLPDTLSASIAYAHIEDDGEIRNALRNADVGGQQTDQARGKLKFSTSDLDAVLSVDYLRDRSDRTDLSPISLNGVPYPDRGKRRSFSSITEDRVHDNGGVTLKLSYALNDNYDLRSITAYRGFHAEMPSDNRGADGLAGGFDQDLSQRQLSQELQLFGDFARWNFIVGAIGFKESFDMDRLTWSTASPAAATAYSVIDSASDNTAASVYGQIAYSINDRLKATAGLRYSHTIAEMDSLSYRSNASWTPGALIYSVENLKDHDESVTPKLALNYQWAPTLMTYASWSLGETTGGFNSAAATLAAASIPVANEKASTYEMGIKSLAFAGRVQTNAAIFYTDYRDYQSSILNPWVNGAPVAGAVILNAGKAEIHGAEIESTWRVSEALDLGVNIAYLHSEFKKFERADGSSNELLVGEPLPYAPELAASAKATYSFPSTSFGDFKLNGIVRFQDSYYSDVSDVRKQTETPKETYVDGALVLTTPDAKWTSTLSVANLFDRDYAFKSVQGPYVGASYNRARQILLGVRRDFF